MSVAIVTATSDVILAIGFRNYPVFIWNAFKRRVQGQCIVDANNGIDDMVFNPNPDIPVLVVSYNDGRLCLFDYTTTALAFTLQNQHARSIKCSADGRSLATGGGHGIIEVFDFHCHRDGSYCLASIYRVNVGYESIRGVELSSDGLRFVDICDKQCQVWAPAALVRMDIEQGSISDATTVVRNDPELSNTSDGSAYSTKKSSISGGLEKTDITSPIVASKDGHFVIAGKKDGTVAIFSTATGNEIGLLYQHARGASIVAVSLNESGNLIVPADDSGRILAGELKMPMPLVGKAQPEQRLPTTRILLDRRLSGNVKNLLINHRADRIYMTGYDVNELWEFPSGKVLLRTVLTPAPEGNPSLQSSVPSHIPDTDPPSSKGISENTTSLASSCSPFHHPTNPEWFVIVAGDLFHAFKWAKFEEVTPPEGLPLKTALMSTDSPPSPRSNFAPQPYSFWHSSEKTTFHIGPGFVVELVRSSSSAQPRLYVWPAESFDPHKKVVPAQSTTSTKLESLGRDILAVLGFAGTSMVYLDTSLWICSTILQPIPSDKISSVDSTRRPLSETDPRSHFFALSEWPTATGELKCAMIPSQVASRQSHSREFVLLAATILWQ
ncbi:uncharacterized protein N7483_011168 [Penicillium malachiteum]|uniref:uncharacterized protein n=1 Tax=Penicillium malachiteum TaxID=1324776 RepID=UPI002548C108|nr:uncharacterized protein N7483_011168 [Penicillium malachiteum]KAJ5713987.1 hypothetical protein N7483_011168 [Penicillium malachiteum]